MIDDNNKYNMKIFLPLKPQEELNNQNIEFHYYNVIKKKLIQMMILSILLTT